VRCTAERRDTALERLDLRAEDEALRLEDALERLPRVLAQRGELSAQIDQRNGHERILAAPGEGMGARAIARALPPGGGIDPRADTKCPGNGRKNGADATLPR
jgi:hypothetical protein